MLGNNVERSKMQEKINDTSKTPKKGRGKFQTQKILEKNQ